MKNILTNLLSIVITMLITTSANANSVNEKKGWYWYEEPVVENRESEERVELPSPPTVTEMMKLHPDDISELINDYHKQFVWRPTEQNAVYYLAVQDAARRKSVAASAVQQLAIKENPTFDAAKDYPLNKVGNTTYLDGRRKEISNRLVRDRENYGLIFFTQKTCQYCPTQDNVLRLFQDKYGWEVKSIDMNERSDLALRFNITYSPTVLLIQRDTSFWKPIASGLATLPQLEDGAYRTIRLLTKEINPQQYFMLEQERGNSLDPTVN